MDLATAARSVRVNASVEPIVGTRPSRHAPPRSIPRLTPPPPDHRTASLTIGWLVLAAFATWGGGSALLAAGSAAALPVLFATAPVVTTIGLAAYGVLRARAPLVATTYLATRLFEAATLALAATLLASGTPALADAGQLAYLAAMAGLGIGSVPFCVALLRHALVPAWLALWGSGGYVLFALGMVADMAGLGVGMVLLVPGGLFEIAFAAYLIARGFRTRLTMPKAAPHAEP